MRQSETLSSRLRFFNGEAKKFRRVSERFYVEDFVIYSGIILASLGFDCFYNVLHYLGLMLHPRPFDIGCGQLAVAGTFSLLLLRRMAQWREITQDNGLGYPEG